MQSLSALIFGIFIALGLTLGGMMIKDGIVTFKQMDRVVSVKGLASVDVEADVLIWPIQFVRTGNDLPSLYLELEKDRVEVEKFLSSKGFSANEITASMLSVVDRLSDQYANQKDISTRYIASQTLSLYTSKVLAGKEAMNGLAELGKKGINFKVSSYENRPVYMYTKLNDIKPQMIEEATISARGAAQKFADDSKSRLGKIKSASQGQFSIADRDSDSPHIKTVRVVSTVNYYLND